MFNEHDPTNMLRIIQTTAVDHELPTVIAVKVWQSDYRSSDLAFAGRQIVATCDSYMPGRERF